MKDALFNVMYKKALRFLGLRLRSEKEMRQKVQEWLYKKEMDDARKLLIEQQIVEQLYKDHFLDDKRFAEEWVASRMRSKPRGEILLRMELSQKGIGRDLIDDIMFQKSNGDQDSIDDMRAGAMRIAEKYVRKLAGEEDRAFSFKLSQALARKGFSGSVVKSIVDELLAKRYNSF
jgi:regulatory protein